MGAYVSIPDCLAHYNVTVECGFEYTDSTNTTLKKIGKVVKGEFEGDPDIAGIGVSSEMNFLSLPQPLVELSRG